jgi:hypothetical protein
MKPTKELLLIKMTFSALFIPALLLTLSLASAQPESRIYLQLVDTVDSALTVDVVVDNVTDLYGAEFRLKYDPAVLSPQDLKAEQDGIQIDTGSLLSTDQIYVVANEVDKIEGIITFAVSLLNPAPPINECGSLARINFNLLQNGPAIIDLEHAKLVSFDLETIPSDKTSLAISSETVEMKIGNEVAGLAPDNAASATIIHSKNRPIQRRIITQTHVADNNYFTWWRITAMMLVFLGVSILGIILVLGSGGLAILTVIKKRNDKVFIESLVTHRTQESRLQSGKPRINSGLLAEKLRNIS